MKNMIKELESKLNNKLALNSLEGKLNFNTTIEEMNKLIQLYEGSKKAPDNFWFERGEQKGHAITSQGKSTRKNTI